MNVEGEKYYVVEFDSGGNMRKSGYSALQKIREELSSTTTSYTDVVLLAHGWNTRRRGEEGRLNMANRVVPSLAKEKPEGVTPLFVAIAWPSFFTTLFDRGSGDGRDALKKFLSEVRKAVTEDGLSITSRSLEDAIKPDVELAVDDLEKSAEAFIAEEDEAQDNDEIALDTMPLELRVNVAQLVNEVSMQNALVDDMPESPLDDGARYCTEMTADVVESRYQTVDVDADTDSQKPGGEDTPIDGIGGFAVPVPTIVRTAKRAWRVLFAIQDLLFGTYERRASVIGARGVHTLIAELMRQSKPSVRFSGFGHSLGAHVLQSAAIGLDRSYLPRKMHTLLLAQGACVSNSLDRGGAYRPLVSQLQPVAGPILATLNSGDPALIAYDVFLPSPYGRVGFGNVRPFRKQEVLVYAIESENWKGENIRLNKETCYSLDCGTEDVIKGHSDVQAVEVSRLFWKAVQVEISEKEYEPTDPALLPRNYWSDHDVRSEKKRSAGGFRCTIV